MLTQGLRSGVPLVDGAFNKGKLDEFAEVSVVAELEHLAQGAAFCRNAFEMALDGGDGFIEGAPADNLVNAAFDRVIVVGEWALVIVVRRAAVTLIVDVARIDTEDEGGEVRVAIQRVISNRNGFKEGGARHRKVHAVRLG